MALIVPLFTFFAWAVRTQSTAELLYTAFMCGASFAPLLYARVVATLPSPWARPFRSRWSNLIFLSFGVLSLGGLFLLPPEYARIRLEPAGLGGLWDVPNLPRYWIVTNSIPRMVIAVASLIVAIHAVSASRVASERRRSLIWAWAFGQYDVFALTTVLLAAAFGLVWTVTIFAIPSSAILLTLLSYGILKHQILDIDLRLKAGISGTVVAGVIASAALVGGELIERAAGVEQLWGAVAIGALTALAFRPISRFGTRLASQVLPEVENTPAYLESRRREIYSSAVHNACLDGRISDAERAVLDGLIVDLELPPDEAQSIEDQIVASEAQQIAQADAA